MKRTVNTIPQGEFCELVVAKLEGDACDITSFKDLMNLIKTVADTPDLIRTVAHCPTSIRIMHTKGRWTLESTTVVERTPDEREG